MSYRLDEVAPVPVPPTGKELAELTATVSRWGTEAGFLGIEGHLEGRVSALVREASVRIFGNCEAERDRLLCRIEAIEKEYEECADKLDESSTRRDAFRGRRGPFARLWAWFTDLANSREARSLHRRNDPELRKSRLDFEIAERARRDACEWREMAAQFLRASYEYQKARAATVRPEKEQNHDKRDNRQFIVHRAN
jgi:hypothetical protein